MDTNFIIKLENIDTHKLMIKLKNMDTHKFMIKLKDTYTQSHWYKAICVSWGKGNLG